MLFVSASARLGGELVMVHRFHYHAIENENQNLGMSEAKHFRYYRISIN